MRSALAGLRPSADFSFDNFGLRPKSSSRFGHGKTSHNPSRYVICQWRKTLMKILINTLAFVCLAFSILYTFSTENELYNQISSELSSYNAYYSGYLEFEDAEKLTEANEHFRDLREIMMSDYFNSLDRSDTEILTFETMNERLEIYQTVFSSKHEGRFQQHEMYSSSMFTLKILLFASLVLTTFILIQEITKKIKPANGTSHN
jgi:hypothetical protein